MKNQNLANSALFCTSNVYCMHNIYRRIYGSRYKLLSQGLCFSWIEGFVSIDRFSVVRRMASLSLILVFFLGPAPGLMLLPIRGIGYSAQEGIVDRPGMERRAWLVFSSSLLFNSNSHLKLYTISTLVAPTIWNVKATKQFNMWDSSSLVL